MWDKTKPENIVKAYDELPLIPKQFKLSVIPRTKKQFDIVKNLMHREDVDYIIDCGDMGAEGHILQWFIRQKAGCTKPVKRFCATSMTNEAIQEAMNNLREVKEFEGIIKGEFCKKKADWIMGMSLSRCFSIKYNANISAGRVQSPTLYFVAKRYYDVINFLPVDYYTLKAELMEGFCVFWKKDMQNIIASEDKDEKGRLLNKQSAVDIANKVKATGKGIISKLETKNKATDRPQLYDITELQRDGNRIFGYTADMTLQLAQSLYEKHKILTYPRTDSRYITKDLVPYLKDCLDKISHIPIYKNAVEVVVKNGLNIDKKIVDDSKVSDHHALLLTDNINREVLGALSADEKNILHLVASRIIVSLSARYTYRETQVEVTFDEENVFRASGRMPVNQGWKVIQKALLGKIQEENPHGEDETEQIFEDIQQGQEVMLRIVSMESKKTEPLKLHTEATLLTAMEHAGTKLENGAILKGKGIGTQATRAAIIKALFTKKYITSKKEGKTNYLIPTKVGMNIIKVLPSDLYSPKITADWEEQISKIAKGELTETEFLEQFNAFIKEKVRQTKESNISVDFAIEKETFAQCPFCGGKVVQGKIIDSTRTKDAVTNYYCTEKSCGFMIAEDNAVYIARTHKILTASKVKTLITKNEIKATCVNKNQVAYEGIFKLEKNAKGKASLVFAFDNKSSR